MTDTKHRAASLWQQSFFCCELGIKQNVRSVTNKN